MRTIRMPRLARFRPWRYLWNERSCELHDVASEFDVVTRATWTLEDDRRLACGCLRYRAEATPVEIAMAKMEIRESESRRLAGQFSREWKGT